MSWLWMGQFCHMKTHFWMTKLTQIHVNIWLCNVWAAFTPPPRCPEREGFVVGFDQRCMKVSGWCFMIILKWCSETGQTDPSSIYCHPVAIDRSDLCIWVATGSRSTACGCCRYPISVVYSVTQACYLQLCIFLFFILFYLCLSTFSPVLHVLVWFSTKKDKQIQSWRMWRKALSTVKYWCPALKYF